MSRFLLVDRLTFVAELSVGSGDSAGLVCPDKLWELTKESYSCSSVSGGRLLCVVPCFGGTGGGDSSGGGSGGRGRPSPFDFVAWRPVSLAVSTALSVGQKSTERVRILTHQRSGYLSAVLEEPSPSAVPARLPKPRPTRQPRPRPRGFLTVPFSCAATVECSCVPPCSAALPWAAY